MSCKVRRPSIYLDTNYGLNSDFSILSLTSFTIWSFCSFLTKAFRYSIWCMLSTPSFPSTQSIYSPSDRDVSLMSGWNGKWLISKLCFSTCWWYLFWSACMPVCMRSFSSGVLYERFNPWLYQLMVGFLVYLDSTLSWALTFFFWACLCFWSCLTRDLWYSHSPLLRLSYITAFGSFSLFNYSLAFLFRFTSFAWF